MRSLLVLLVLEIALLLPAASISSAGGGATTERNRTTEKTVGVAPSHHQDEGTPSKDDEEEATWEPLNYESVLVMKEEEERDDEKEEDKSFDSVKASYEESDETDSEHQQDINAEMGGDDLGDESENDEDEIAELEDGGEEEEAEEAAPVDADTSEWSLVASLSLEYFSDATKFQSLFHRDVDRSLLLVLIHDATCPYSVEMLDKVESAAESLLHLQSHVRFGSLELHNDSSTVLKSFGIEKFPTLLFISWISNMDSILFLEYTGLRNTASDIAATVRHYYIRLVLATSGIDYTDDMAHAMPPKFDSLAQVQVMLAKHDILPLRHPIPHPLPPSLSEPERQYVQYMLREEQPSEYVQDETNDNKNASEEANSTSTTIPQYALPDDSVIFVQRRQCRELTSTSTPDQNNEHPHVPDSYGLFDQMSRAISNRRDRFFAIVEDCGGSPDVDHVDGTVLVYSVPYDWDYATRDFIQELVPHMIRDDNDKLVWQITRWSTPSLLWFDRETTAPIVFGLEQKLHAILVVNTHFTSQAEVTNESLEAALFTRTVVRHFRRVCRARREWACVVLPSTETRVLNTLGVDIWTPLDVQAMEGSSSFDNRHRLLPVLVLTDQRTKGKTFTHMLDHPTLRVDPNAAILKFFDDFHHNRLKRRVKSDPRGPRTNDAGVRILTADSYSELDNVPHALLLLVSPTCGHCKRTNVLWNRLSALLQSIQWDWVSLFRLDVTVNEVPTAITPKWLPDMYYYSNQTYVRLTFPDDMDVEEVDVLDRFLAAANVSNTKISSLLKALESDS